MKQKPTLTKKMIEKSARAAMKAQRDLYCKCPKCGSSKFVISIFGSICGDCFYEEKSK